MASALDFLRLARPKHWAKGAFVLLPVPFGLASGADLDVSSFALGLLGFSLATSAVYAFNDAQDAEADRKHPDKALRPVAAGRIAPWAARIFSLALLAAGVTVLAVAAGGEGIGLLFAYVGANTIYTLGARNVALLDVFILSAGFVIRVLLGCALLGVPPSNWLLLCSTALALFLSLVKRRAEFVRGVGSDHRPSLAGYSRGFLDQAIGITAAMAVIAYGLYTIEAEVLRSGREFASLPFVLFGVLDYLRIAHVRGDGGSPVDLILASPALMVVGLGWSIATLWSLGLF